MNDAIWNLRGVHQPGSPRPRLDAIDLTLRPGVTAIIGNSGAGKTSLLNLLVGFEKPGRGLIEAHLPSNRALPLFWSPPDGGLWPHLNVQQHLEAVTPSKSPDRIRQLLEALDLLPLASAKPDRLSQGERSRLTVARSLASEAAVIVLDEPLVHVDPARVDKYWEAIRSHVQQAGASLVFSTHAPERVLLEAERVVCLRDGRLIYEGTAEELYARPTSRELALCLGPANWFEIGETHQWLQQQRYEPCCLRPEQIQINRDEQGELQVRSARFAGAVAQADLSHKLSGATRTFFHRPSSGALRPGDLVRLRVLVVILLALLLTACGQRNEPVLSVRGVEYWSTPSEEKRVPSPRGVAVAPNDDVYVLDTAARILVYDDHGQLLRQWRMPEFSVGKPESLCILKDGRIAVPDTHYHRVVFFDSQGHVLSMFGTLGNDPSQFIYPVAMAQDDKENLYVCEYGSNDRVQKFTRDGKFVLQFGHFGMGVGEFQRPSGIVWHAGKVYIADAINNRIQVFTDEGKHLEILGAQAAPGSSGPVSLNLPYGVAVGPDEGLYVIEYGAGRVTKLSLAGALLGRYGTTGTGEGQFSTPWGIAVDDKGRVRVADTGNRRVVELTP